MPPTLLVIHHSHTDLGDTDPQAVVEQRHAEFLDVVRRGQIGLSASWANLNDLARDLRAVRMRS
jgi:hypothetical protein